MGRRLPVYGLDIETDTTLDGLDPARSAVVTAALSQDGVDEVFTGPEPRLLAELDDRLGSLEPGVVATWNGAAFDLPFLADRAARWGIRLGLLLRLDPSIHMHHPPLRGHEGAYRAAWHQHGHIDAYRLYRGSGPTLWLSASLKNFGRLVGFLADDPCGPRRHDLTAEAVHAHASSDARLARVLTERRWPSAARVVDRLPAVA